MSFKPNSMTFAKGIQRLEHACKDSGLDINKSIITSRDSVAQKAVKALEVTNIPSGFVKFQLPIHFEGPTQTYMSFGAPRTKVPVHSHDEGSGVRVIMFGSIIYKGHELTAGDWMYIPKGKSYEFEVGAMGVGVFYCYECCCA